MSYQERPLGEVLSLDCDKVEVRAGDTYAIAGVYGFGRGLFERESIAGTGTQYQNLHRLHAGTVVLSKLKAFEGAIAVVSNQFEGRYLSPEFPTFAIDPARSDIKYLSHLFSWRPFWSRLAAQSTGIGSRRERVSPRQFLSTMVPLPDLTEQRRVASEVERTMSRLDRITDLRHQSERMLIALRESLIGHVVDSVHHEIGSVMTLVRRPVIVEAPREYREIGLRSFGRGVFHKPPVLGASLGTKKVYAVEPGDLLFSSVFAWEGAVAQAGEAERGRVGSHRFMTYTVDQTVADPDYLRFFFLSAIGLGVLQRCSPGGAGRNKTLGILAFQSEKIALPPLQEQQRLARILLGAEFVSRSHAPTFNEQVAKCRASLLNAAFTGML